MDNVPDDWGAYYRTCTDCGYRAHGSENYECKCPADTFKCGHPTCDTTVEDEGELSDMPDGTPWCTFCVGYHGFTCETCGQAYPDADRARTQTDEAYCTDCIGDDAIGLPYDSGSIIAEAYLPSTRLILCHFPERGPPWATDGQYVSWVVHPVTGCVAGMYETDRTRAMSLFKLRVQHEGRAA